MHVTIAIHTQYYLQLMHSNTHTQYLHSTLHKSI